MWILFHISFSGLVQELRVSTVKLVLVTETMGYAWLRAWVLLRSFSRVQLFAVLWTVARQAPLSIGFSREEYWSGLPGPPPGDLPASWPRDRTCASSVSCTAGRFFTPEPPGKPHIWLCTIIIVYGFSRVCGPILIFHPHKYFVNSNWSVLETRIRTLLFVSVSYCLPPILTIL